MHTESPQTTEAAAPEPLEQLLVDRIRAGSIELPLLPQVASRILGMVNDPNAEAAKLAALIHQDQALAAHVIRIANSPAYKAATNGHNSEHFLENVWVYDIDGNLVNPGGYAVEPAEPPDYLGELRAPSINSRLVIVRLLDGRQCRCGNRISGRESGEHACELAAHRTSSRSRTNFRA